MVGGLTDMEIANEWSILINSIKPHVEHTYRKFGAESQFEAGAG